LRYFASLLGCWLLSTASAHAAGAFTIYDAINQAVLTNPGVGEAAANRRATEAELRQNQATLLPQVHLDSRYGLDRFNIQDDSAPPPLGVPPIGNQQWLTGWQGTVVVRQLVFDGFSTINQIWRQAARVDSGAYRVRERTELIALDSAEAYIDVVRYSHLVNIARENLAAHRKILSNVQARFQGGRAGEGDLQQVEERVQSAEATLAQYQENYDQARAAFRKTIGIEPYNLRVPTRLAGLPGSKDAALAVTLEHNPTIQAAQADRAAAKYDFESTTGAFFPTVNLEGRASRGNNVNEIFGRQSDVSLYATATWDIFRGGQDSWKRVEAAEKYQQVTMAHARLQRDALESIDKAWAARTITNDRIAALVRELAADRKVIAAYQQEYELGQRSLIDLLNAQNGLFNALVQIESARSVAIFADYQLLAAMGQLLDYLKMPHPVDSEPLVDKPVGLIPTKLPPVILRLPEPGSEPLNISHPGPVLAYANSYAKLTDPSATKWANASQAKIPFNWPGSKDPGPAGWSDWSGWFTSLTAAPASSALPSQASAYAAADGRRLQTLGLAPWPNQATSYKPPAQKDPLPYWYRSFFANNVN
jgi:adhesin transport system outer membrane protein